MRHPCSALLRLRTSGRAAESQALSRSSSQPSERAATLFFSHPDFNRRLWNFTKSTAESRQNLGS
jgi:hypothetical protein